MDSQEIKDTLEKSGALKKGHFRLSSGRHSDTYIQCALLLQDPRVAAEIGRSLAVKVALEVDIVLCPALGAVVAGFATALALGCDMIFAERVDGKMGLRRGFEIEPGARVLVVEDVITTGGSVLEMVRLAEDAGAEVVSIACIVDRGSSGLDGYPTLSLVRLEVESYLPEECPMCEKGLQIDAPGSRYLT